ncbi:MAG: LuxR C-terminal-related transcriptional regulator, partial [Umezawaea sp.]
PAVVADGLEALGTASLVVEDRFRHAAIRTAVLGDTDPAVGARLHRRAAAVLLDRGFAHVVVARHLLAAGRAAAPTEPWERRILLDAAEHAVAGDELDLSRRYLELAREQCPAGPESAEITVRLSTVGWRLGAVGGTGELIALLAAVSAGHVCDRHAVVLAGQLLWQGKLAEAAQVLRQVDCTDEAASAELRITRLWVALSCPALLADVPPLVPSQRTGAVVVASNADARLRALEALDAVLRTGPDDALVNEAIRILEVCSLKHMSLEPSRFALQVLLYAGRLTEARTWCEALLAEARRRGVPAWMAAFAEIGAQIAAQAGDLPEVVSYAREALTHLSVAAWGAAVGVPLGVLVTGLVGMGRFAEAEEALNQPVPPSMFETRWGLHYLHARGRYYLATGRLQAALGDFLAVGEKLWQWDLDFPALIPWRSDAAEAQTRLGERAAASRLVREQVATPGDSGARLRGVSLRVLADVAEDGRERLRLAKEAVACLEVSGDRLELARAVAGLASAHRVLGDFRRARMVAGRAVRLATACKAEPLVETLLAFGGTSQPQGRVEAEAHGHRVDALTDAERRIAELAATGSTNREIARTLFITVNTVEQHLTKVYRKLKVRRRTDLPVQLDLAPEPERVGRREWQELRSGRLI